MTGESYKYEGTIRLVLPGNSKESEYKIVVAADNPAEAATKFIEEWKRATEPRDVRVKEISKVITAS
jgi:ribosomal protein S16